MKEKDKADYFYIILNGEVRVFHNEFEKNSDGEFIKYERDLLKLKAGDNFGELALIDNSTRKASIICLSNCIFAILDKEHYKSILNSNSNR